MKTNVSAYKHLDALGDATRRSIFQLLARKPHAVGRLAVERDGARTMCVADPAGVVVLRNSVERFRRDGLAAFERHGEERKAETDDPSV